MSAAPSSPPAALLFDVFGTVVDWRGSILEELAAFGVARGLRADFAGLVDAWRGAYQPSLRRVREGERPFAPLDELHRASLDELLPRFGLGQLGMDDRAHLNRVWHRLHPWPDAVAGLTRLRQRFIVGTLSNGNVALLVDLARFGKLPFDVLFSGELFGTYKPRPETYLGACRLLALPPERVMLVAAHNDDLAAAQGLGLRTGFVARPMEYGPGQTRDRTATGTWDAVARDFLDLAEKLGA